MNNTKSELVWTTKNLSRFDDPSIILSSANPYAVYAIKYSEKKGSYFVVYYKQNEPFDTAVYEVATESDAKSIANALHNKFKPEYLDRLKESHEWVVNEDGDLDADSDLWMFTVSHLKDKGEGEKEWLLTYAKPDVADDFNFEYFETEEKAKAFADMLYENTYRNLMVSYI